MRQSGTITHYLIATVTALALTLAVVAAQSPDLIQAALFATDDGALPTVDPSFDYGGVKAPPLLGELPDDVPTVPESNVFEEAPVAVPVVPQVDVPVAASVSPPVIQTQPIDVLVMPPLPEQTVASETSQATDNSLPFIAPPIPIIEIDPLQSSQANLVETEPAEPQAGATIATTLTQPWWAESGLIDADQQSATRVELDQLIWKAIERSPYVRALLLEPQIQEARASSTLGAFDPTPFINSLFNDTSNPVGNTLTTGGPTRLNENLWENSAGVRAKTQTGAQTELTQEMNLRDSNSVFFLPGQQADSRMVLRYTQPLMRGAGKTYNRSSYVVANLASSESTFDVTSKIQQHVFTISANYWELYYARANYQQSERGLERLTDLRNQLEGRSDLDSLRSQLYRADSQISKQRSAQARAHAQMVASEAKLRAAIGATEGDEALASRLIPATLPADWKPNLDVQSELGLALSCHPSILANHARIKAAKVRLKVAENELRPTLNLVMEGYARGLNGDYNVGSSFGDQFSQGAPSYSAGMSYQRPYRNVAAKAILREKRLEMQKLLFELDNALLVIGAEVESEIASAEAAYLELESAVRATLAAHAELEYLTARWSNVFLEPSQSGTSLLLDQLLNANVQLIQAENVWARAQADHMLALARVRLASGTLLSANPAFQYSSQ